MVVMKVKVNDKTHVMCLTQCLVYRKHTLTGSYYMYFFLECKLLEVMALDSVPSCSPLCPCPPLPRLVQTPRTGCLLPHRVLNKWELVN